MASGLGLHCLSMSKQKDASLFMDKKGKNLRLVGKNRSGLAVIPMFVVKFIFYG